MEVLFRSGAPVYRILPTKPQAADTLRLQYNRMSGPFSKFSIPEDQTVTLLYGFNGWQSSGKAVMKRVPPPAMSALTRVAEAVSWAVGFVVGRCRSSPSCRSYNRKGASFPLDRQCGFVFLLAGPAGCATPC